AAIDVDSKNFSQQCRAVLPVAEWITAAAAVSGADVQVAIRPKLQQPAVVIRLSRMGYAEHHRSRGRVCNVRVSRDLISRDRQRSGEVGVENEEPTVCRIRGMKRHAEQASLTRTGGDASEIEKGSAQQRVVSDDADCAVLLYGKDPRQIAR